MTTRRKEVLTTGQVARLCQVAPRTVSKWFDTGQLKGYRVPGSKDRRVPVDELIRFMKHHGMPLRGLETDRTRLLIVTPEADFVATLSAALERESSFELAACESAFDAGMVVVKFKPQVILIDTDALTIGIEGMAASLRRDETHSAVRLVAITRMADQGESFRRVGFDSCLVRPFDTKSLVQLVSELTGRQTN